MTNAGVDVLARTIWAEARGEGSAGMQAVACVVVNRLKSGVRWWGDTIITICLKPWQFSCWNANDPNREKLLKVTITDPQFALAMDIAQNALAGQLIDATGGADSYYPRRIPPPVWARGLKPCATIGNHLFFITRNQMKGTTHV